MNPEDRERALLAQLAPLTGARATATAIGGSITDDVAVPRNTYLVPIRDGEERPELVFKTSDDATLTPAGVSLSLISNSGGARHNLRTGTELRWDPPVPGARETVRLSEPAVGGADPAPGGALSVVRFDEVRPAQAGKDLFASAVSQTPAFVLVWAGDRLVSEPLRRGAWLYDQTHVLYCVSPDARDARRRTEARRLLHHARELLLGRSRNVDGELLTSKGSVTVESAEHIARSQTRGVFALTLKTNCVLERRDDRSFPFLTAARLTETVPGTGADLPIVDDAIIDIS
jgi:hypothetical protein